MVGSPRTSHTTTPHCGRWRSGPEAVVRVAAPRQPLGGTPGAAIDTPRSHHPSPGRRAAPPEPRWHHRFPRPPPPATSPSSRLTTGPAVGYRQWLRPPRRTVARSPAFRRRTHRRHQCCRSQSHDPSPCTGPQLPPGTPSSAPVGPITIQLAQSHSSGRHQQDTGECHAPSAVVGECPDRRCARRYAATSRESL